ncbi:MAG: sulfurtransferase TusA family protein [Firmicutes bacterium]|nr:sulfurtransferase TusA family protein [Bacillota bacterium]
MLESIKADKTLDCTGLYCPVPVLRTREEIDKLAVEEVLEVLADDTAAEEDIKAWAKRAGQQLLKIEKTDEGFRFLIKKIN